jgi:hypothetical protein
MGSARGGRDVAESLGFVRQSKGRHTRGVSQASETVETCRFSTTVAESRTDLPYLSGGAHEGDLS